MVYEARQQETAQESDTPEAGGTPAGVADHFCSHGCVLLACSEGLPFTVVHCVDSAADYVLVPLRRRAVAG